jgi:hypothetical protein
MVQATHVRTRRGRPMLAQLDRPFSIEGVAELTLETHTAGRPETTGRMFSVVAGEGFEPPTSGL